MALDFLEDIYKESLIIEYVEEMVVYLRQNNVPYAIQQLWQRKIIPNLEGSSFSQDESVISAFLKISENLSDASLAEGMITGQLLPRMYDHMLSQNGIDVQEGKYSIKSSDSGFLTIRDEEKKLNAHSTRNPMFEAHEMVRSFYDPAVDGYGILGIGLGYLPYQIWTKSNDSVKIRVYETDEALINYAYDYGVIGWIDEKDLEIVRIEEENAIAFFDRQIGESGYRGIISPWLELELLRKYSGTYDKYMIGRKPIDKYRDIWIVNNRKNRSQMSDSVDSIKDKLKCDEMIVVAGGPSVDYNIDFLKESKGKRLIVAVDAIVRKLLNSGIMPDVVVAVDSFNTMIRYITGIEEEVAEIPLITPYLTNWKYMEAYKGKKYSFQTRESVSILGNRPDDGPLLDDIGATVASAGLSVCYYLGAKTVYLVGVDLGHPGGKEYASGVVEKKSFKYEGIKEKSVDGGLVSTTPIFVEFRKGIERQLREHPDVKVINMSKDGLYIHGALKPTDV